MEGQKYEATAIKQIFCDYKTVSAKYTTLGALRRDFLMPLLSAFWKSINRKARVVVSLGMCLMAWSADDD